MATKCQIELALKALLTELHHSGQDLYTIADEAIRRMHQTKLSVKENTSKERDGAEDAIATYVQEIAGNRPDVEPGNPEEF